MTGIVDWAASRARMVMAFIALSLLAGGFAYTGLPKEGEPDIEIPALFVSVPFPGISAEDSESLLVKTMETELSDLDGLKTMTSTAAEGYAGVALEFEFGWDKTKIMADVRQAMSTAEGKFPDGYEKYSINEINFSEFPIIIVNLTGDVPERTMARVAKDLQERVETLDAVLEAGIAGNRDEMVEVVIDPLRLESYNVTAGELINVVQNNNLLVAAGEIESAQGAFSIKIPSSFSEPRDIYSLPVKVNGDRVVTLGDLAEIRLTFEDRLGTARFNGEPTVALQVVKRKGFNLIDTAAEVQRLVDAAHAEFPEDLRATVQVGTAIALVMIVVLSALGSRAALLVGFAIPTSFLLCFVLLAVMGITISNIVMFGLILAVGMLVDAAIVVVEYADKRIAEGTGPMHAYVEAAKRMFWPIISSTATTLCAFLPMLFWPGVPGEFMGMLPVTLIFVLCASLIVALIYLPVMGGVTGRISRVFAHASDALTAQLPWIVRAALVPVAIYAMFLGAMQTINPDYLFRPFGATNPLTGPLAALPGALMFIAAAFAASITLGAAKVTWGRRRVQAGTRRTLFGWLIKLIAGNPIMPLVTIALVIGFVISVFTYFAENNNGVEFFTDSEPEQAIVYVRARGNLSLPEKDALVAQVEEVVLTHPGVMNAFAFAGDGGLDNNTGGAQPPLDTIGQVQLETIPWEDRPAFARATDGVSLAQLDGDVIIADLTAKIEQIPGLRVEILAQARGPASAKPVHLRLKGEDWDALRTATDSARTRFDETPSLTLIEDTLPLPGIDWQIDVDVEKAGRFGADVATVGAMVQLVTRGLLLDTMRVDTSDEEIDIRVRLPEQYRVLSTLDTLKVRTADGLVPLANFISRQPVPKLAEIKRINGKRYFDVKAGVASGHQSLRRVVGEGYDTLATLGPADSGAETITLRDGTTYGLIALEPGVSRDDLRAAIAQAELRTVPITANDRINLLTEWLDSGVLPDGIEYEWTGDQEDQAESQAFLQSAFAAALALMFIILLAQFNSFYNATLVLIAVVLSTTGVLIGMLVMNQPFSIIMTGTGIVALAGIVVNNNIVLIDTYQEYSRYMPRIEAIIRTAEDRIRPVLLTTVTTMAGLDFINGGYSVDSPTALWWKQLATAVVFGLGIATVLTLVFTPSLLALRIWAGTYVTALGRLLAIVTRGRSSRAARDWALRRAARRLKAPEIIWEEETGPAVTAPPTPLSAPPLKAAE